MPSDLNVASWSVMINLDRWNYVPLLAPAGHGMRIRNAIVPPIRASAASNSCMAFTMCMRTAWSGVCANEKRALTLWLVSNGSGRAIQSNCAYIS